MKRPQFYKGIEIGLVKDINYKLKGFEYYIVEYQGSKPIPFNENSVMRKTLKEIKEIIDGNN